MSELPGVLGDGMPERNGQRKTGTARGSPRRSRTAKAPRISRRAAKSWGAREWGGWGRLSDDGPGQQNPESTISDLIDATIADYERHGASAIAELRKKRPVAFVQLVAAVAGLIEGSEPVW